MKRTPNIFPNGKAEVEIRKLMDVEDFGEGFTPNEEIAKVKFQAVPPNRLETPAKEVVL